MECYACENEATRQCRRCARVYCELHGGELCAECLSPASALPSFTLYRGSLLALLVGSAIAIWLLVRPAGEGGEAEVALAEVTPTAIVTEIASPESLSSPTPGTVTPEATQPPSTATPAPTEAGGPQIHTVLEGETLVTIAQAFAPPGVNPLEYAFQIAAANGITDPDLISPGDTLILP